MQRKRTSRAADAERSVEIMRRLATLLVAQLLLPSCGVDHRCDQVCAALRSVRTDSDGYLPRDEVFRAAGIEETDLNPFSTIGGGSSVLDCGCWLTFTERNRPGLPTGETIDAILSNPNRTAHVPQSQLASVSLVSKRSEEICRVESVAARRSRVARESK
jgi:hypothetical protein